MLYQIYEAQRSLMEPFADFAQAASKLYSNPLSPFGQNPFAQRVAAGYDLAYRLGKDYEKPTFGITTIEVDLRNEGSVALSIRMAFKTGPGGTVPGFLTPAMLLPVGSGWQHFSISIVPSNLIPINNPGPWASFFIGEVRFIHQAGASNLSGDNVVGMLGIDNIRAVPEPASSALLVGGLLALGLPFVRARHRRER